MGQQRRRGSGSLLLGGGTTFQLICRPPEEAEQKVRDILEVSKCGWHKVSGWKRGSHEDFFSVRVCDPIALVSGKISFWQVLWQ